MIRMKIPNPRCQQRRIFLGHRKQMCCQHPLTRIQTAVFQMQPDNLVRPYAQDGESVFLLFTPALRKCLPTLDRYVVRVLSIRDGNNGEGNTGQCDRLNQSARAQRFVIRVRDYDQHVVFRQRKFRQVSEAPLPFVVVSHWMSHAQLDALASPDFCVDKRDLLHLKSKLGSLSDVNRIASVTVAVRRRAATTECTCPRSSIRLSTPTMASVTSP